MKFYEDINGLLNQYNVLSILFKIKWCSLKKFLNSINVDMNYWTASYPYGSYDIKSSLILKENGCKLAVTADSKISILNSKNRFFLPRIDANNVSIMMR